MSDTMLVQTKNGIRWIHTRLLAVTADLPEEQFLWRPGPMAPPIGWHLWHIARWADRFQTMFPPADGVERRQLWEVEGLAQQWDLDPSTLGPLQSGEGMDHEAAARLPRQIGRDNIVDYARRTFDLVDRDLELVTEADVDWVRPNIAAWKVDEDGRVVAAPAAETPLATDLYYHYRHAARHLGMIEGLRGVQGLHGTASI